MCIPPSNAGNSRCGWCSLAPRRLGISGRKRVRRILVSSFAACTLLVCTVPTASAQNGASIIGVVKDATGAVLPGVTVEAASPALIEKVRTVASDPAGQYKIVDLRP